MYTSLTVVVVLIVGVVALSTQQPPPPTIAEFAPQAQEQIEDAPDEQATRFGEGAGAGNGEGADPGSDAAREASPPPEIEVPRVRDCVGDPPRQTEDPQSPPCVPYWDGDNGGATWQGVTRNEIRIVAPSNVGFATEMARHFNARYEMYGRQLIIIPHGGGESAQEMQAAAVAADDEHRAFASLQYGDSGGREFVYYNELARREIISMNGRPTMYDEADLARFHPFQWSYLPGHDKMSRNKADWACRALKDERAEFADGAESLGTRVFGLVVTVHPDGSGPDLTPMKAVLSGCGIALAAEIEFVMDGDDQSGREQAQTAVAKLRSEGVTTVLCQCHTQTSGYYMGSVATANGYNPEWVIGTYMYQAEDVAAQLWDPVQIESSFGMSWWSKQLPPQDSPWYWAVNEGNPDREFANYFDYYEARWLYNGLLMMVAGIQMAGPHLTPQSFADGLQSTTFPNPNAGGPPYYQGEVGFANEHTAVNDAALVWLTKSERSNWSNSPGAKCYANSGLRYREGSWPSGYGDLFEPPCY